MEEIYANVEFNKSGGSIISTSQTGSKNAEGKFHGAVVLCLGLLSVFLLAGLIGLSVHYLNSVHDSAAELSRVKANLTQLLQDSKNKVSSLTEERDQLNVSLTEITKELDRLHSLSRQKITCPAGWTMFSFTCYLLSKESGSWGKGRDDCRSSGADLVIIDSDEEETFLSKFTSRSAWIGLNDMETEGTWKWIDDTPLTLTYWAGNQPDNGGGDPQWGDEDCAHLIVYPGVVWNDLSCTASLHWLCEKIA